MELNLLKFSYCLGCLSLANNISLGGASSMMTSYDEALIKVFSSTAVVVFLRFSVDCSYCILTYLVFDLIKLINSHLK